MKNFCIFLVITLLACSKSHPDKENIKQLIVINKYLERGSRIDLPYIVRLANTDSAYQILKNSDGGYSARRKLFGTCLNYQKLNQSEKLMACAKFARRLARIKCDTTHEAISYYYIGQAFMYKSVNDSAFVYLNKAFKISQKRKLIENMMVCSFSLAELCYYTCDYLSVEKFAKNAIYFARQLKDKISECAGYNWMAISANELGDYKKANEYYDRSLLVFENSPENKVATLYCKGFNFYKDGKISQAIAVYREALSLIESPAHNPEVYTRLIDALAYAKFMLKEYDSLPMMYNKSARFRDSFNIDAGRNFNKLYLSEYYAAIGDTLSSLKEAYSALEMSENFKAPKDILCVLKQLALIDKKRVREISEKYIALSDSLQLAERLNRNKFARIAFETDEIEIEKNRAIKHKWIVSAAASSLLLLITLLFVIRLQRAKQKELILIQNQQKADESIYQLINDQQLKVDEGRQAEKKRIAQELHDGIMNRLASTRLNLFILNKSQDDQTIKKCLSFINNIQDIEKEIRQVAHDLNHEIFSENKGFALLLETLFNDFRNITGTRLFTEIDSAFNWEMTESVLRMNIYRILQEALQNSYKYANAKNIFVTLTREENFVRIIVHDDGTGFDTKKIKKGMGIKSIADRAAALKGEFKIISGEKEGTILNVLLPLSKT